MTNEELLVAMTRGRSDMLDEKLDKKLDEKLDQGIGCGNDDRRSGSPFCYGSRKGLDQ